MGKVSDIVIRLSKQLDIATSALNEVMNFRFDPNKPVADRVRLKAKVQKALDDIRKLESNGTAT